MKFNKKVVVPMLIGLLIAASGVQAAVRPALTRIVALESDKETPIKLINDDKIMTI